MGKTPEISLACKKLSAIEIIHFVGLFIGMKALVLTIVPDLLKYIFCYISEQQSAPSTT